MEWPKITIDTPREELIRIHEQIWNYTIEHGDKPYTPYFGDCAACEFDGIFLLTKPYLFPVGLTSSVCKFCPLGEDFCSNDPTGLYRKWLSAKLPRDKWKAAIEIRDAEFKSEEWFEEVRRIYYENKKGN